MTLTELTSQAGEWLRGGGPMHDVVISSRARLARNLSGLPFLTRCNAVQRRELEAKLREQTLQASLAEDMFYVDVAKASDLDRRLLVERHLISRHHAEADHPRGVAVSGSEQLALMVNEEDHLRIQVLRTGLQLRETLDECLKIDDRLEQIMDFSFHKRYGYLTACPTNVGTGLRVSVMLHLPGLRMTGEIEKAFRAARDMHLAIRGLYGEGTEASGDFFQISNQTTLGKSEQQIVEDFLERTIPEFVEYERTARTAVAANDPAGVDDRIFRAEAILRSARLLSTNETMHHLSMVRLGVNLGRISHIPLKTVNELFLLSQPAHLQRILGQTLKGPKRAQARADFVRDRLAAAGD